MGAMARLCCRVAACVRLLPPSGYGAFVVWVVTCVRLAPPSGFACACGLASLVGLISWPCDLRLLAYRPTAARYNNLATTT